MIPLIAAAIASAATEIGKFGYSIYQDQRDTSFRNKTFDYQKDLQKQIFEREDNAVQRRRADLEAAGLNPNLAAGSAAGAGSVVATSGASAGRQLQGGADLLNSIIAYQQAKGEALNNKILQNEEEISRAKAIESHRQNIYRQIQQIFNQGMGHEYLVTGDGEIFKRFDKRIKWDDSGLQGFVFGHGYTSELTDSKIWQSLQNGFDLEKNARIMSDYDTENYSVDRWFDRITEGIGSVTDLVDSVTGGYRDVESGRYSKRRGK